MKRRLLMAAGMSALVLATAVPTPGMARGTERFGRVTTGRAADISSCQAQVFGSPSGLESVATPGVFAAPRGFLPPRVTAEVLHQ